MPQPKSQNLLCGLGLCEYASSSRSNVVAILESSSSWYLIDRGPSASTEERMRSERTSDVDRGLSPCLGNAEEAIANREFANAAHGETDSGSNGWSMGLACRRIVNLSGSCLESPTVVSCYRDRSMDEESK